MSVASYNGMRSGGESLAGSGFNSSLKKSHLGTNSNMVTKSRVSNEMASKSVKSAVASSTAAVGTTVPAIKVSSSSPTPAGNGNNNGVGSSSEVSSTTPASTTQILPKAYGKIVLTLENVLLGPEKLSPTPSSLDGLEEESETDLRLMGCELITTAGILLKLPQTAMATGQVLFQRFYYSKSFIRQPMEPTAMACVYLASKIEEAPRRIRDVVNVFHHIKLVRAGKPIQPMILDTAYIRLKNDVTLAERRVLKELGFCVHVKHPHKLIVIYLQQLTYDNDSEFVQKSWNYMSDALRTNVFVRYTPEAIACACIYLSARVLNVPLPNNPPWYMAFDATEAQIIDICESILELYERPKVNYELLENKLEQLIKTYQESKQKAKSATSTLSATDKQKGSLDTPTSASPHSRPPTPQGIASAVASSSAINNGKEKVSDETKDKKRDESSKGKRSAASTPEPIKRGRRSPSPIIYDDSPSKRHKSKKRKKTSSRYARSYSSSRSRSRSRERKSSKKRSRRTGRSRSRSRSYSPLPPKRHHHHKHKSHRR